MKYLTEKTILLISPQPWNHIFISKHHYAEELAKAGNRVYFLNPPSTQTFSITAHPQLSNLYIINWTNSIPSFFRFHLYPFYCVLMKIQIKRIINYIQQSIDIVWCFDFNLFPNLKDFGATFSIFHPVDPLSSSKQYNIAKTADLIISVSDKILQPFTQLDSSPCLLINHGLSETFAQLANTSPTKQPAKSSIQVGYFGNLDRGIINWSIWQSIIQQYPSIEFHFWGPHHEQQHFAKHIKTLNNVISHGIKNKQRLALDIVNIDIFLLIYHLDTKESDRSNSHKLLEYLSTGKVIISSLMDHYKNNSSLIKMPTSGKDAELPEIFKQVSSNLNHHNQYKYAQQRKAIAQQYTYTENLNRIDNFIINFC